ncbi:cytochrome P450 9e2-like [Topomyia yanbarensis]|uniref:cytochrome P450 9e2-like n=1 Tax=Topomyia yanbarensis TaxID=2498891 RepID=UPI00273BCEAC|nr:cytochrome P450 9e2-like [Topomyia yanbarensis]
MDIASWILVVTVFATVVYLGYRWSIASFDYFVPRRVPFVKPWPLFGGLWPFFAGRMHTNDAVSAGYRMFPEAKFSGLFVFRRPGYLVHDLELVKQIAIKDFDHFTDHANNLKEDVDPLVGRALFFMEGSRWRHGRSGLSPAFTGSKMRNMFVLISSYTEKVMRKLMISSNGETLEKEMEDLFQRLSTDVITSISLGMEADSIHEPKNEFFCYCKRLISTTGFQGLKLFVMTMLPAKFFTLLRMTIIPRDVAEFYEHIVATVIKHREQSNISRPDFIHLMMLARKNELKLEHSDEQRGNVELQTEEDHSPITTGDHLRWTDMDIAAAAASFFVGGVDSTTTLLCFALYELSLNPEIQDKLREEVDGVANSLTEQYLSYEALQKMKFLDMVVMETLRRWSPSGVTNRKCIKPYIMVNSDGTQVTVEKGQLIVIPIQAIHTDPRYYPNPMRFNPERFSDENRHTIDQNAFLPFGNGPRNCIGSRLALMQIKCLLYQLLAYFVVKLSSRTDVPVRIDTRAVGIKAKSGFWFKLTPRAK